jgi:hypothetical protein
MGAGIIILLSALGCGYDGTPPMHAPAALMRPTVVGGGSIVAVRVEAVVTDVADPNGVLAGAVAAGASVQGEYVYDETVPDVHSQPGVGRYVFRDPPAAVALVIGDLWFRSNTADVNLTIKLVDDKQSSTITDTYEVKSVSNLDVLPGVGVVNITISLEDTSATALGSDALLDAPKGLAPWTSAELTITGADGWTITAALTSATPGDEYPQSNGPRRKTHTADPQ